MTSQPALANNPRKSACDELYSNVKSLQLHPNVNFIKKKKKISCDFSTTRIADTANSISFRFALNDPVRSTTFKLVICL
jgi:hypothetical protein